MKEKKKAVEEEEQIQATEESTEEKDEGLSLKTAIKAGPMLDIDG